MQAVFTSCIRSKIFSVKVNSFLFEKTKRTSTTWKESKDEILAEWENKGREQKLHWRQKRRYKEKVAKVTLGSQRNNLGKKDRKRAGGCEKRGERLGRDIFTSAGSCKRANRTSFCSRVRSFDLSRRPILARVNTTASCTCLLRERGGGERESWAPSHRPLGQFMIMNPQIYYRLLTNLDILNDSFARRN